MTPCSPAITFCSMVGHASFQTAGPMGPSMSDRSNGDFFWLEPAQTNGLIV